MEYRYEIKESARARSARITVHPDGSVVVTKPRSLSMARIERFITSKSAWIQSVLAKLEKRAAREAKHPKEQLPRLHRGTKAYLDSQNEARTLVTARVRHFAQAYGFRHGTISIRNQKSRWGSCTREGNLSFNYRIIYLPPELADYLIVHELAHTVHHNHSREFWARVGSIIPEYRTLSAKLKRGYAF